MNADRFVAKLRLIEKNMTNYMITNGIICRQKTT